MNYAIVNASKVDFNNTHLVLPLSKNNELCAIGQKADTQTDGAISKLIKRFSPDTDTASSSYFPIDSDVINSVTLIGTGEEETLSAKSLKKVSSAISTAVKTNKLASVLIAFDSLPDSLETLIRATIRTTESSLYNFDQYKSKKASERKLKEMKFVAPDADISTLNKVCEISYATTQGMNLTRDLGNQPGNVCTPDYLAETADQLTKECKELSLKVLEEKDMEALNMGAFLSVSKGSSEPGKMIILEYTGADKDVAPHVLVGKGITFDTGGISLKPGAQMDEMKYDMCGAASVLGTFKAITQLKPKANYIGIIAAAENMPAGHASKPGDIVTSSSGQTIEILNTDAEGRLVLCDALTYAEQYEPASVVDIATLTGACIIALGHHTSAVMGNDDSLVQELLDTGNKIDDRAWQLPIWDEYQEQIESPFADIQNIGGKGAGSITAACFLSKFTTKYKWAHLDIAGTAWVSGGKDKGATGRPVPLLLNYLLSKAS